MGNAVLTVWTDVVPEREDDFNAWYDEEHVAERVAIPGIRSGQRYVAVTGSPRYFAWYGTDDLGVLTSAPYRAALDSPSPRTKAVMPHFRNIIRTACTVLAEAGEPGARAPFAGTLRLTPAPGRAARLRRWLADAALPAVLAAPGIRSAQLWRGDPEASSAPDTAEARMRGAPDRTVDLVLIWEGASEDAVRDARHGLDPDGLHHEGAATGDAFGIYRLLLAMEAPPRSP